MCCVRPGVRDAKARRFCCARRLMAVDLPALLRPTKAISASSVGGNWSSLDAVVRKRAVWVQASAALAAAVSRRSAAAWRKGCSSVIVKSAGLLPNPNSIQSPGHEVAPAAVACHCPCLPPCWPATPSPQPKADLAKGQAIATQVCGACHSFDGSRGLPANPILQGQHPEYLVKQLHDFKSGARNNAIMKGFATHAERPRT